jgi:hypothetical protein
MTPYWELSSLNHHSSGEVTGFTLIVSRVLGLCWIRLPTTVTLQVGPVDLTWLRRNAEVARFARASS